MSIPDGRQLLLGVIRPESPLAGKSIPAKYLPDMDGQVEILAVFREGRTYHPQTGFVPQGGDQMLVIVSFGVKERLSKHFASILA